MVYLRQSGACVRWPESFLNTLIDRPDLSQHAEEPCSSARDVTGAGPVRRRGKAEELFRCENVETAWASPRPACSWWR